MKSRIDWKALVEKYKQRRKESEEEVKKGLEAVKVRILPKKGYYPIRRSVRDFLAERYLIPTSEDSIGGKGLSDEIIDFLFLKGKVNPDSNQCLARYYQEHRSDYWNVMKKYLKRFFRIRSYQRKSAGDRVSPYDFEPLDYPRPDDYPTYREQRKALDKMCKVGRGKLKL
jgi:hypothetical protein